MRRGDIFRVEARFPERGDKPGFWVVVSRDFVATRDEIATVVCAPVYSNILGIPTEVVLEPGEGVPRASAIRCDFVYSLFKRNLTQFTGTVPPSKIPDLNRALSIALGIPA